jgi:hypothetical protein
VTPEQIRRYRLPLRPSKPSRKGAAIPLRYERGSVEVDALRPEVLRRLINDAIERHIDERQLRVTRAAEASEREIFSKIAGHSEELINWSVTFDEVR